MYIKAKLKECILMQNRSVHIRTNMFHLKLQKFSSYESWSSYKGGKRWKNWPVCKVSKYFQWEGEIKLTSTVIKLILFDFFTAFFVIFFFAQQNFILGKKVEKKKAKCFCRVLSGLHSISNTVLDIWFLKKQRFLKEEWILPSCHPSRNTTQSI